MADPTPADDRPGPAPLVPQPDREWSDAALPVPPTSFVGRERDLAWLHALVRERDARLLTLTGPGGVGKTRLAIEAAAGLAGEFPGGVAFVSLADIADPGLVAATIARRLRIEERGDRSLRDLLIEALAPRAMLLVLDNLEHLLSAAPLLADLLTAAPDLTILATSRRRLRLPGERAVPVAPLALPDANRLPAVDELGAYEAVRLWGERAWAANPVYRLTPANAGAVAAICRQLDGLPLAIELAAAWARVMPPESILRRLERRLRLLTGGPQSAPSRLQTMRAAIAWSVDLLGASERALLIRLAVFTGGFTADAAESVWCAFPAPDNAEAVGETDVPALLSSLVDAALLQPRANAEGEPRLAMLETVREFGLEQLALAGEETAAREALVAYLLAFAEVAGPALQGPSAETWFYRIEAEIGSIRSALTWLGERGRVADALRLTTTLGWFWTDAMYIAEGRRWYDAFLPFADAIEPRLRATALLASGDLAYYRRDKDDETMRDRYETALALWRELGDSRRTCDTIIGLAAIAMLRERYDEAAARLDEALALADEAIDPWQAARIRNNLGFLALTRGDWRAALAWEEEALRLWRVARDEARIVGTLDALGWAYLTGGDLGRAWDCYDAVLESFLEKEFDYRSYHADCFDGVAAIAGANGAWETAAKLSAAAAELRATQGLPAWPQVQRVLDARHVEWEAALGSAAFARAWAAGRRFTPSEAVAEARAVPRPASNDALRLSPRERDVLRLLAEGASDSEIAARLYISLRIAPNHVHAVLAVRPDSVFWLTHRPLRSRYVRKNREFSLLPIGTGFL